jgi:hypothetical protein
MTVITAASRKHPRSSTSILSYYCALLLEVVYRSCVRVVNTYARLV